MMMNRSEMIEQLQNHICEVSFTKVNGDERVMTCTLMDVFLPETKGNSKNNEEVIPVYDVMADGWRSFRVDSVTNFVTVVDA
jgi:hypothetical protein